MAAGNGFDKNLKVSAYNPTPDMLEQGKQLGAWYRAALRTSGLNTNVVAQKTGITTSYLYMIANDCVGTDGRFKKVGADKIRTIAEATGVDVNAGLIAFGYAADKKGPMPTFLANLPLDAQAALQQFVQTITPQDLITVPVVGTIGAGTGVFSVENVRERVPVPAYMLPEKYRRNFWDGDFFGVRVRGNCLAGLHIIDGDLLIFHKAESAQNNDIVAVVEDDEALAKRYREEGRNRWIETVPEDGKSEEVEVGAGAIILGVKIGLYRAG